MKNRFFLKLITSATAIMGISAHVGSYAGDIVTGKELYNTKAPGIESYATGACAACHTANPAGNPSVLKGISVSAIKAAIVKAPTMAPLSGKWTDVQLDHIATYIASIAKANLSLPLSTSFGDTAINATKIGTIVLSNTGGAVLTVSAITVNSGASEYKYPAPSSNGTCGALPITIPAKSNCSISVTFIPTTTGIRAGELTITSNGVVPSTKTALTGTGSTAAAAITTTPTQPSFVQTTIASTSNATITVANSGTANLTLSANGIAISGAAEMTRSGGTCSTGAAQTLAPQSNCTIILQFKPTSAGDKSGILAIQSNVGTTNVTITGKAVASTTTPVPNLTLSATTLSYGNVLIGQSSAAKSVTLRNIGSAAVTISALTASGTNADDFIRESNCGTTLAPSASCIISATFKPSATGTRSATVTITHDNNLKKTVAITGVGTTTSTPATGNLSADQSSLSFDGVVGSASSSQILTYSNTAGATVTISKIGFSATDTGWTSGVLTPTDANTCKPGTSLAANASCKVFITFNPKAVGTYQLNIKAEYGTQSLTVPINATVTAATTPPPPVVTSGFTLNKPNVDLGTVKVGTTVQSSVVLSNTNASALTVNATTSSAALALSSTCGANGVYTIPALGMCDVTLTMTSAMAGSQTATANFTAGTQSSSVAITAQAVVSDDNGGDSTIIGDSGSSGGCSSNTNQTDLGLLSLLLSALAIVLIRRRI